MELSQKQYRRLQYHLVQFLTEHLSDASRAFDGDLQEMLVLAVVGQSALHAAAKGREIASISASSLSEVTGLPRQTVRRKLESLKARGWIAQMDDSGWRLVVENETARARADLDGLDWRGIERLLRLVKTLGPHVRPN